MLPPFCGDSVTYLADTAPENGGSGKRSVVVENIVSVSKGGMQASFLSTVDGHVVDDLTTINYIFVFFLHSLRTIRTLNVGGGLHYVHNLTSTMAISLY